MSATSYDDYVSDADQCIIESTLIQEWSEAERLVLATRAQAEASLALAYEQRTANLIALRGQTFGKAGGEEMTVGLYRKITERLEL